MTIDSEKDCPWCSPCRRHDPDDNPSVRTRLMCRDAVIEAAKAFIDADVQTYDDLRIALGDAVEALLAAEKGE